MQALVISQLLQETGEWVYKNIPPRIVIEEYINDGNGLAPNDYRFFTYNGVPGWLQVDTGRFDDLKTDFYDSQWNRLPLKEIDYENHPTPLPRPPHFEQMLELAQKLGKSIDFYDTSEKVYLGEITTTPGNGMDDFQPPIYNYIFGALWEIHNKNSMRSPRPVSDMRQITRDVYELVVDRQRKREYSQEEGKEV